MRRRYVGLIRFGECRCSFVARLRSLGAEALTTALCEEYRQHSDAAVAVLSGLTYRSEESVRAEAVIAQLRRLRDDCDVAARLQSEL